MVERKYQKNEIIKKEIKEKLGTRTYSKIISLQATVRHPVYRIRMIRFLHTCSKKHPKVGELSKQQMHIWKSNFRKLIFSLYEEKRVRQLISSFYEMNITKVKSWKNTGEGPIVLCAIYNDLNRIKRIMKFYRETLGVSRFAFIDNASTDGTYEFLKEQDDVALYYTDDKYDSRKKAMWLNYMMTDLGEDRWYLAVDSDECFVYPGYENISLEQYTQRLTKKGIEFVKAYMLELYPDKSVFDQVAEMDDDFMKEYVYFDSDNDSYIYNSLEQELKGGFHARTFQQDIILLSKIPLFIKTKRRFFIGSHNIMPLKEDIKEKRWGGILWHYKFLPSDKDRIDEIVAKQNYAHGSMFYRDYQRVLNDEKHQNMMCQYSMRWDGSRSFDNLPLVEDICKIRDDL